MVFGDFKGRKGEEAILKDLEGPVQIGDGSAMGIAGFQDAAFFELGNVVLLQVGEEQVDVIFFCKLTEFKEADGGGGVETAYPVEVEDDEFEGGEAGIFQPAAEPIEQLVGGAEEDEAVEF